MSSSSSSTTAVTASGVALSLITNEILKSTTNCVEAAANNMAIDLTAGGTILIEGCTFVERASTGGNGFPDQCSQGAINATISGANIGPSVSTLLQSAIHAKQGMEGNKNTLIERISESLTSEAIAFCSALAVNNLALRITAVGNITIKNCSIKQDATAMITRCVHNVTVDGMPLSQFLILNLDGSGQYEGITNSDGTFVPTVAPCPTSGLTQQVLRPLLIAIYIMIALALITLLLTPVYLWRWRVKS